MNEEVRTLCCDVNKRPWGILRFDELGGGRDWGSVLWCGVNKRRVYSFKDDVVKAKDYDWFG